MSPSDPPDRVLLIRPSALGDVCRSVPVLASLRAAFPTAQIDWLVRDVFADAIRAHPALSGVIPFERSRLGRTAKRGNLAPSLRFLRTLRRKRYDLVIDAQGLLRSGVFAWATRAPRRIGHADAAEGGAWWLTERVASDPALHTVDRMMSLLEPLRVPAVMDLCLHTPPTDIVTPDEPYVVVAPTSRWASKRWPIERYDALAERLRSNYRVVVVGGPGERPQCAPLLHRATHDPRVIDCVGQTSVGGLMRLIERSSLVVANDSAALHMAVGFDRPTVALFGPTRVDHVGPYGREADVIQHVRPDEQLDHKRDEQVEVMRRINVDEVLDACNQRLASCAGEA